MENRTENADSSRETDNTKIDFTGLILGLSGAALSYLGHLAQHDHSKSPVNLGLVKQNIEILVMLQEKTKGNLNTDEDRILRQVIADLQFRFIEASKGSPK